VNNDNLNGPELKRLDIWMSRPEERPSPHCPDGRKMPVIDGVHIAGLLPPELVHGAPLLCNSQQSRIASDRPG